MRRTLSSRVSQRRPRLTSATSPIPSRGLSQQMDLSPAAAHSALKVRVVTPAGEADDRLDQARRLLRHLQQDWPAMDVVLEGASRRGKERAWGERAEGRAEQTAVGRLGTPSSTVRLCCLADLPRCSSPPPHSSTYTNNSDRPLLDTKQQEEKNSTAFARPVRLQTRAWELLSRRSPGASFSQHLPTLVRSSSRPLTLEEPRSLTDTWPLATPFPIPLNSPKRSRPFLSLRQAFSNLPDPTSAEASGSSPFTDPFFIIPRLAARDVSSIPRSQMGFSSSRSRLSDCTTPNGQQQGQVKLRSARASVPTHKKICCRTRPAVLTPPRWSSLLNGARPSLHLSSFGPQACSHPSTRL